MLKEVKKTYQEIDLIVGNNASSEAALALEESDADAIKVCLDPESICTTRFSANVGVPQLSAIFDTANAIEGEEIPNHDGVRYSWDIVKVLAAGVQFIQVGSGFAGVDESPDNAVIYNNRKT